MGGLPPGTAQKKSPDDLSDPRAAPAPGARLTATAAPARSGQRWTEEPTLPTGWGAAMGYRDFADSGPDPEALAMVRERAVQAVLDRARRLLRHGARPMETIEAGWPAPGELDLDLTLARPRPWSAEDLRVVQRLPRDADVVAVLDMSLSMTGEKIALLAVAAAILRLKLERLGVVAFDSAAHVLAPAGSALHPRAIVRRVLEVPARGYTNIHAGLEAGADALARSTRRERLGLLLSDGVANLGPDPALAAARYPRLHVVQIGAPRPQAERACRAIAEAGRGRRLHAPTYAALPRVVRDLLYRL